LKHRLSGVAGRGERERERERERKRERERERIMEETKRKGEDYAT